ncbi:30S ribosomal protein S8 [Vampirovibrio sp.]|uniref:30S ribosomal protein S8 n=1 Tax=Vampirovibrio sp. TaxID=2717857 RepID=UPI0035942C50
MYNDPIADMLTRIRNASNVGHPMVEVPASKLKLELAKVLQKEGYIRSFEIREAGNHKTLRVLLKYDSEGYPLIRKLVRVSRPGLRKYYKVDNLPRILGGGGTAIVSTPQGLLSDREARRARVGGEVLCYVY